jgi:hypothetical protein
MYFELMSPFYTLLGKKRSHHQSVHISLSSKTSCVNPGRKVTLQLWAYREKDLYISIDIHLAEV